MIDIQTNHIDSWKVFSSITDSVTIEFSTEYELKSYLASECINNGKLKAIETLMSYPYRRCINGNVLCDDNSEGMQSYYRWTSDVLFKAETYEDYTSILDKKLNDLMSDNNPTTLI